MTDDRPLENGWLPDTPVDDTLLRRFLYNQVDCNEELALACGGRAARADAVAMADSGGPVAYFNQALLLCPLVRDDAELFDLLDDFYAPARDRVVTMLSLWPTPDLSARGWVLMGHPAFVARGPGPGGAAAPAGVEVCPATTAAELETVERIAIEGYPIDECRGMPPGRVLPPAILDTGVLYRYGTLDGEPVAVGGRYVGHGVVNLCLAATLPAARRRGVWEQLVWERVRDAPDSPAVAFTSDFSRPGFVRMGFLPVTRFTLWARLPG